MQEEIFMDEKLRIFCEKFSQQQVRRIEYFLSAKRQSSIEITFNFLNFQSLVFPYKIEL